MKKKSLVMMLASLSLVGTIMVGATFAYFTDTTAAVTNTFVVGADVGISLLENITQDSAHTKYIKNYSKYTSKIIDASEADQKVEYVEILPSVEVSKKPYVSIKTNTSECYIRVKVTGIDELEAKGFTVTMSNTDNWEAISKEDTTLQTPKDGIYQYKTSLKDVNGSRKTDYLFTSVKYNEGEDGTKDLVRGISDYIQIKAFAVQAEGFNDATTAFTSEKKNNADTLIIAAIPEVIQQVTN